MTQAHHPGRGPCFAASGVASTLLVGPGPRAALCERALPAMRVSAMRVSATTRRGRARASRTTSPAVAPTAAPAAAPEMPAQERFDVRDAEKSELYTVADVRCEAFYKHPTDPYFYPMRRREIYTALVERVSTGSRCLVVTDPTPPTEWRAFCQRDGSLVVASLDLTLHDAKSGQRVFFGDGAGADAAASDASDASDALDAADAADGGAEKKEKKRLYVSSMAVRGEWRRRGLARELLRAVEDTARQIGVEEVFLHVDRENEPAVALYCKEGFSQADAEKRRVPEWLGFLAKREHTLLTKRVAAEE